MRLGVHDQRFTGMASHEIKARNWFSARFPAIKGSGKTPCASPILLPLQSRRSEFFFVSQDRPFGEEGGAGDYIPGLYASLINITPNKTGFALGTGYLFYAGSVGANTSLPFGGILAANINADVSLGDVTCRSPRPTGT